MSRKVFIVALLCVGGFIIGNGAYSLYNANALSYLSSDSAACNNCHVMNEVYHDYTKSSHQSIECIDCHLPHSFARKWLSKAYTGINHAYHFTFDSDLPANFTANAHTKAWVKENCIRCHGDYAHNAINPAKSPNSFNPRALENPSAQNLNRKGDNSLECMSCHHSVGHLRDF